VTRWKSPDDHDLRQGGPLAVTDARVAIPGRCAMTTLCQAMHEYLRMRRNLRFKLYQSGKGLLDFDRFRKKHRASLSSGHWRSSWSQQPRPRP
jgi:hypothetical protein